MNGTLRFLGTSDSKGVPRFWCNCAVCQEARSPVQSVPGANRRTRPGALLRGNNGETLLLDCGPDLVEPMPEEGLDLCGYRVHAFEVPHGANGASHAFHFAALATPQAPAYRWVYMTDAIGVPADLSEKWLENLDLLVLGSSFLDESAVVQASRSVYDLREALSLPWARAARRVLLTHLSHDIDVRQLLPDRHYRYASDGLSVSLSAAVLRTGRP